MYSLHGTLTEEFFLSENRCLDVHAFFSMQT